MLLVPYILAFSVGFVLDLLAAHYMRYVADKRALPAAIVSATIGGAGLVAVLVVVSTPWAALADIAGSFTGAYVAVKLQENA